jgi:hypothetical protein
MAKNKITHRSSGYPDFVNIDYPAFDYLYDKYKVKSMVDIGCGMGCMVDYAIQKEVDSIGIDGDKTLDIFDKPEFVFHDYTEGKLILDKVYDLGWSVEFLEHVEEKYLDNMFSTFSCCKIICCTHALPDQHGVHHVNCQLPSYWLDVFARYGFKHDLRASLGVKKNSEMRASNTESFSVRSPIDLHTCFMKRTGAVFINEKEVM